ncbi:cupin domain-containing protein [Bdellovibrio sp. HCB209]|uniref:cupin domain-containing protein n=1 Tax=Bdellovibrio sp. HCB209 TaxID=3394354 RepID=UPI0039B4FFD4
MGKRHSQVVNIDEVDAVESSHGNKFANKRKRLGALSGSQEIGCSWYEVPPGKQAFPHHAHYGNEESFFIISGSGQCRIGNETVAVRAGDFVSFPRGEDYSHSLFNNGFEPLVYLGVSTANQTDIMVYPDSKKIAIAGGANMHAGLKAAKLHKMFKDQPNVDYYLDEE